jgi:hypothetical protein
MVAALMSIFGCGKSGSGGGDDAGGPPANLCATRDMALSTPQCQLTLGQAVTDYIRSAGDTVWYVIRMPASTNAKSILHVQAGYSVPGTVVNLSVKLFRETDSFAFLQRVDNHGQGAPKLIDMLTRYTDASVRVLVQLSDQSPSGRQNFDPRNQFSLVYQVVDDPNPHPPNVVAPITLTNQGQYLIGSDYGYLVTPGDVHKFSVTVSAPFTRKIIYLHVTAPAISPPPPFRLSYTLVGPDGSTVAQDQVQNSFLAVDLATARLVLPPQAGLYTLSIQAYQPTGTTDPIDGDLRVRWNVEFRLMDDIDANEPNDTMGTATPVPFSGLDTTQTFTGRLSYVPDHDWYQVQLPAWVNPTLFHYKLTPSGSGPGPRFDPLTPNPDRELRAFTIVPGGASACVTDQTACPKGYGTNVQLRALVEGFCTGSSPALCLQSMREENFRFTNLSNFEGMLTVPPQSGISYYVVVQSFGSGYADDAPYTLTMEWLSDPDETSFYSGGAKQPKPVAFANDATAATYPYPPNPGSNQLNGKLSYGHGLLLYHDPNQGQGVRAAADYDSTISDTDVYVFNFPGGQTAPQDRGWEIQWTVTGLEYELAVGIEFCNGDVLDGGACTPVSQTRSGQPLSLAYIPSPRAPWQNPNGPFVPLFGRDGGTTTLLAAACGCFEPQFVRGGTFKLSLSAADRNAYQRMPYTLLTAYTTYPQNYVGPDGGSIPCPPPVQDAGVWYAGCRFTGQ